MIDNRFKRVTTKMNEFTVVLSPTNSITTVFRPGVRFMTYNKYNPPKFISFNTDPVTVNGQNVDLLTGDTPNKISYEVKAKLTGARAFLFNVPVAKYESQSTIDLAMFKDEIEFVVREVANSVLGNLNPNDSLASLENSEVTIRKNLDQAFMERGVQLQQFNLTSFKFGLRVPDRFVGAVLKGGQLKQLAPGDYYYEFDKGISFSLLPTLSKSTLVTNQEVLTKDNIALRFSYNVSYKVSDAKQVFEYFDMIDGYSINQINEYIHLNSQVLIRDLISQISSEDLNSQRSSLLDPAKSELEKLANKVGVEIESLSIRDITFPKSIQDMFGSRLEAEMKARAKLEIARAEVAAARAEKNAAEIIDKNPTIKYLRWLDTLQKMSEKGRHTFKIVAEKA